MHPLVIYSHGFVSNRNGGSYIAENLASHGYVVVSADYPLTHGGAPGGPVMSDVVHQPGDVTFLIDAVIDLNGANRPFPGRIDTARIGVAGFSLGGLTSTLVAFHPRLRDRRIKAAVSIAGPAHMLTKAFFDTATLPFLMIAGTFDALIDYTSNASTIPERAASGRLVTIERGSHTSFTAMAEPLLRFMANPDALGCTAVMGSADGDDQNVLGFLGDERDGIVFEEDAPAMCSVDPRPGSLHPGRQHMIAQIAVLSFLESVFSTDTERRRAATRELTHGLPADFAEVTYRAR
jgi:predicted dienelactone hydrolase